MTMMMIMRVVVATPFLVALTLGLRYLDLCLGIGVLTGEANAGRGTTVRLFLAQS